MNILYTVQQSIYDNEGRFTICDSNIQMMAGILREITIARPDWHFYVLIQPLNRFLDLTDYSTLLYKGTKKENVTFIPFKQPRNAFYPRINFDVEYIDHKLGNLLPKIDLLWNNICEVTRNWKTYFYFKKLYIPIISCNYWLDCPTIGEEKIDPTISYELRQIDAAECADLVPFTCESGKERFFQNMRNRMQRDFVDKILPKSVIWEFGASYSEIRSYYVKERYDKLTVIFPNRLSPTNYTHHLEFFDAVNSLYEERQDFQVIVCNPSNKFSWVDLKRIVKPLYVIAERPLTRSEYVRALWKSHIVASLFTYEVFGGCSNVEGIMADCLPLMPYLNAYRDRAPYDYPGFVSADLCNLKERLAFLFDNYTYIYNHFNKMPVIKRSSYESISSQVILDIEKVVSLGIKSRGSTIYAG